MRRPDFLFIGPDKTGSSWLYEVLRQHPACYVPPAKDIYFFDRYYHFGWSWYGSQFGAVPKQAVAMGELSHDYLFSTEAAARIARDLPAVKLLTILREPAERSFSHYLYMLRNGRTQLSFEQALREFPELLRNSLYGQHLRRYFDLFERRQLGVFFYDELLASPCGLGASILEFLGLPEQRGIEFDQVVRPASVPRSLLAARIGRRAASGLRELGFPNLVGALKHSRAVQAVYKPYLAGYKPAIDPALHQQLLRYFANDLALLRQLIGATGPDWLNQPEKQSAVAMAASTFIQGR